MDVEPLDEALRLQQAGRLDAAEEICRDVLSRQPDHPEANYLLGLVYQTLGQLAEAAECYRGAIARKPEMPQALCNLSIVLRALGQVAEALQVAEQAAGLCPESPEVLNNFGLLLNESGRPRESVSQFRRAIAQRPEMVEAHNNLGTSLQRIGHAAESIAAFRTAARIDPNRAETFNNLANVLTRVGRLDEALACYDRAMTLAPENAEAHRNLGIAFKEAGHLDAALAQFDRALALNPDYAVAHGDRLYTLHFHPDYDAAAIFEAHRVWNERHAKPLALSIGPDETKYAANQPSGGLSGVINLRVNDRSRGVSPRSCPGYVTDLRSDRADTARLRSDSQLQRSLSRNSTNHRLRIGYVSPDLRDHVIGRFMLPLLMNHDRTEFEIFCYSDCVDPDALTDRIRPHVDCWRTTAGLSDPAVADLVREDRIDILVDLAMHMGGSRLLVFARKPAPVQITYLAYCSTTGLETMDYRLTDPYLDPLDVSDVACATSDAGEDIPDNASSTPRQAHRRPGSLGEESGATLRLPRRGEALTQDSHALPESDTRCYSEQSIHLPQCYWCYDAPDAAPADVYPLPALSVGHITFGCLNAFCKITPPTLQAWCKILQAVPGSRLLIHAGEGTHRRLFAERLELRGVDPARIVFVGYLPFGKYFEQYQRIDIALDPFPYAGGTTTCDALWMGVPVVTLAGRTAVGRSGVSILSNLGLPELIGRSEEQYVRRAVELAADLPGLSQLRAGLRERMRKSPLMDAPRFARDVEGVYRRAWEARDS